MDDLFGIVFGGLVAASGLFMIVGLLGLGALGYFSSGAIGATIGAVGGLVLGGWLDHRLGTSLFGTSKMPARVPRWLGLVLVVGLPGILAGVAYLTR